METKKTIILPATSFEMRGNLNKKEPIILEKWEQQEVYRIANVIRSKAPFVLHDGPPYANGPLHVGHMLNRFLKDFIVRFKNMQGYETPIRFGWDTHGLPIETAVTKKGIKWREVGIAEFRLMCEKYALEQVANQKKTAIRLGTFSDANNPYITLTKDYEANQIRVFADLAVRGLIYKGLKPVHWSPSSETALAEAEIEYHDVESYEVFVSFPLITGNEFVSPGDKLIIWTTTPWTLPANLGLCLNPEFEYGLYETSLGRIVVLQTLIESVSSRLGIKNCKLLKTFKGNALERLKAKHCFYDRESLVMNGRYVTDETGTGIVHIAPGHGLDDYNVSLTYGIQAYCPVDGRGVYDDSVGAELAGLYYEKANPTILDILKRNGNLLFVNKFIHSYPHDWRTKKPLIFRATPQWFCGIDPIRKDLLKQINKIRWHNSWSKLRMTNMIKDRADWCISRQRVWGVPIPMIICEDGTPIIDAQIFENIAVEFETNGSNVWFEKPAEHFLPKNYKNSHSPNGLYTKEKDIMDVWFDSGSSYSAVLKKDGYFPSNLYLEGSDQYRGWFNSSLILAVATDGVSPYKECVSHGFILDSSGQKMSKSSGNALDPEDLMQKYGADILRLWAALSDYTNDVKISEDQLVKTSEVYKKIRNTFRFLLSNLSNGDAESRNRPYANGRDRVALEELDFVSKSVLNEFNIVKNNYLKRFAQYDFVNAINPFVAFFSNELSSFYLDVSKDILYCDSVNSLRRRSIQTVLYRILTESIRLLNPILPFTMDEINSSLVKPLSENVQFTRLPSVSKIDDNLHVKFFTFNNLRDVALSAIESLRQDKLVGSAQDVHLEVSFNDSFEATAESVLFHELFETLDSSELARIFGVSSMSMTSGGLRNYTVFPRVNDNPKCERCWNHSHEIIEVEGIKLCPRCHDVLKDRGDINE